VLLFQSFTASLITVSRFSEQQSARTRTERTRRDEDVRIEDEEDLTDDDAGESEDIMETPPPRRQTGKELIPKKKLSK
jgi:hypothetical protein